MSFFAPVHSDFAPKYLLNQEAESYEVFLKRNQQQVQVDETIANARPDRRFNPKPFSHSRGGIKLDYCDILGIQSLIDPATAKNPIPFSSIVVDIHGAVRFPEYLEMEPSPDSNELPEMELAYGIYFGQESNHNRGGIIYEIVWKDKQAAYLYAAITALKKVSKLLNPEVSPKLYSDIKDPDPEDVKHAYQQLYTAKKNTKLVVIKCDSNYAIYCLNKNIYRWLARGSFANHKGVDRPSTPLLIELHELMVGLEKRGIAVQFWGVDLSENCGAKDLAERALDDAEAFMEDSMSY